MGPKITVITSLYKADDFIEDFIYRYNQQTILDESEIIFVNNADDGFVADTIKKQCHGEFVIIDVPEVENLYTSWNRAVEEAKGKYLMNMNIDDYHFYNALEIHSYGLDTYPDFDLCYGEFPHCKDVLTREHFDNINRNMDRRFVLYFERSHRICGCSPMWRKEIHDKIGLFDDSYQGGGDHEMWVRMMDELGSKFIHAQVPTVIFYQNPESLTNRVNPNYEENERIFEKYGRKYQ